MRDSLMSVTVLLKGDMPDLAPLFDLLRNDEVLEHFAGEWKLPGGCWTRTIGLRRSPKLPGSPPSAWNA